MNKTRWRFPVVLNCRRSGLWAGVLGVLLLWAAPAWPAPPDFLEALEKAERRRVSHVIDGDTLVLQDGREVRLVGLQAPKLPLGRKGFREWPFAREARETLEMLTRGAFVTLYYGGRKVDRYGRILAHLVRDDGLWVQGDMLSRGMARVYSFPDNRALVAEMLTRERAARAARRGIWRLTYYAVKDHLEAGRFLNSFQIVEGRVREVARRRSITYLNFGADWRQDFTVVIRGRARRLFEKTGLDLDNLKNKKIRIRGWLKYYNGPMIEATHPEQIEILSR
ncbi:thermonuclease family protein [Luteithermobacter gelatinilyticus]|uniref:thermonuclease family protein n=1 Tax=Luteithermobacter gelatinilyticus TaxID=2582913 RepID=UPI001106754D|nr:thermonuclease family protein [Luteithermobacter gelatinilyticus]